MSHQTHYRSYWRRVFTDQMWKYCKRRCTKHASLIWTYWRCHWRIPMTT